MSGKKDAVGGTSGMHEVDTEVQGKGNSKSMSCYI